MRSASRDGIPPAIELPPEQQRRFLFNAFREFLERAARNLPIVHVFEDLHWADEPTLLLLQHIGQMLSTAPRLLIGTYRDVELEVTRPFAKTLEAMLRQKQVTRISLRRLAVEGVEGMLAALSGQTPPPSLARVVLPADASRGLREIQSQLAVVRPIRGNEVPSVSSAISYRGPAQAVRWGIPPSRA